jgi:hypothetical protein
VANLLQGETSWQSTVENIMLKKLVGWLSKQVCDVNLTLIDILTTPWQVQAIQIF